MNEQQEASTEESNRFIDSSAIIESIWVDLNRLHGMWMELLFPKRGENIHAVLGKYSPQTSRGRIGYRAWGLVGFLVLSIIYPLTVLGLATRFYARKIDRMAASMGVLGVIVVSVIIWSGLSTVTYYSRISYEGFITVAAAGIVATMSAVLALYASRLGGRRSTLILAYPLTVDAIFLPPTVAALYSPTLAKIVFPKSESLAIWLLDNVLAIGGINQFIRMNFELEGLAYVGMWFGLALPIGWILGLLVVLANSVRKSDSATVGGSNRRFVR